MMNPNSPDYRIAILGCPARPDIPWSEKNIDALSRLGFNAIQLNIAWGSRPGDEPLNIEDVVSLPAGAGTSQPQSPPLRSDPAPERRRQRREDLRQRAAIAKAASFRTIFHFGAPYNAHMQYGDNPPNCISDPNVAERYAALIDSFASQFPGVDDLLMYTYDQDAWLCSEFGDCPRCSGVPLHERVVPFVNALARAWRRRRPEGRLWWEPWELSAGQALTGMSGLDPSCCGLSLHSNVAEVMCSMPVDRWLKLTIRSAKQLGLPVIVEHFLGSPTEEMEPLLDVACPLTTLNALREIGKLAPDGIKEYYGVIPDDADANLAVAALYFANPAVDEGEALHAIAAPYADAASDVVEFWRRQSDAIDAFPWYSSWWIREIGRSDPVHGMDAAFLRGQQAHTPAWESTRRAIFMKTDDSQPGAWMLEDVELQCKLAARGIEAALEAGERAMSRMSDALRDRFSRCLSDSGAFRRRALAYAYHIRETNLTAIIRRCVAGEIAPPDRVVRELIQVLEADRANQRQQEPMTTALAVLGFSLADFANRYFAVTDRSPCSRGRFSVTSR